ncbi:MULTISPECIES: TetR/AcrR family transcriptional regulator [Streptomyces]|uniref:TetR/AcrR family transcriptional regulator n=1 Tax=Streptomyces TaxID=1883 RepID=UPI0004CAC9D4|nr:TetR/AcrR family transcriptional regulator [Streptomyces sp. NRRL F-5527]
MDIGSDAPPLTPAGRRIVDAAEELFYERGITAAGVDLIAEHSGVTKRTLYNRFGSKDNLVAAYLTERDRRWRSAVRAAVDASGGAEEAVTAPFEALRSWTTTYTRGCAFLNALAELPDPRHPGHRVAAEQKRWLLGLFEELAAAADCHGPATLATRLFVLHEGAVATAPLSLGTVAAAGDLARALVRAAVRR